MMGMVTAVCITNRHELLPLQGTKERNKRMMRISVFKISWRPELVARIAIILVLRESAAE